MEKQRISNEQLIMNDLQKIGALKDHPDLKTKDIGKGIVLVERGGNIKAYYKVTNGKLEFLFFLETKRELYDFKTILGIMGVQEYKDNNGVFNIYHVSDIDFNSNKPKLGVKPIDIHSQDYFKIWNNIIFFGRKILLEQGKNKSTEGDYHEISEKEILSEIKSGVIRIKDLKKFKDQGQITQKIFDKYLPAIKKLLLIQIGDVRFDKVQDPVTEVEIYDYLNDRTIYEEKGLIDKEFAIECYRKHKSIEEIKQKREKGKKEIHSKTHFETQEIQTA